MRKVGWSSEARRAITSGGRDAPRALDLCGRKEGQKKYEMFRVVSNISKLMKNESLSFVIYFISRLLYSLLVQSRRVRRTSSVHSTSFVRHDP